MTADRVNAPRQAKEPERVVELVRLNAQRAATQLTTSRMRCAVVLVRMPIRQVLAVDDVSGRESAEASLVQQRFDQAQPRMEPELVGDERHEVLGLYEIDQLVHPVERVGEWLLDEEMTPGTGRCEGDREMHRIRICHEHDVRPLG